MKLPCWHVKFFSLLIPKLKPNKLSFAATIYRQLPFNSSFICCREMPKTEAQSWQLYPSLLPRYFLRKVLLKSCPDCCLKPHYCEACFSNDDDVGIRIFCIEFLLCFSFSDFSFTSSNQSLPVYRLQSKLTLPLPAKYPSQSRTLFSAQLITTPNLNDNSRNNNPIAVAHINNHSRE